MQSNLFLDIMPDNQKELFSILSKLDWIKQFYLAGGTGLALQIGHRQSIDFDFFSESRFDVGDLLQRLIILGDYSKKSQSANILDGELNGIRISFFIYAFPIISSFKYFNNIAIADITDIAVMKLEAISNRGSRKDFIDLYYLLKYFTLNEILEKYEQKYGKRYTSNYHLLRSLSYFKDAEILPMPEIFDKTKWNEIKKFIENEVKKIKIVQI